MRERQTSASSVPRAAAGSLLRGVWETLIGLFLVTLAWELLHLALGTSAVPSPLEAVATLFGRLGRDLPAHLGASLARILVATLVQVVFGGALGMAIGASRRAAALIGPAVSVLYPVPKIAFLPVFMITLGIGELSKILFVVTVAIFQTIVALRDGVAEIPPNLRLAARSLGLGRRGMLRHLILPALTPRLFTSARLGIGVGLSALFFAENYATRYGVGYLIMNSFAMADYKATYAGILALSLLALALFAAIDAAERRVCPWLRVGYGAGGRA
ncbi:MAG: ABC transporter permease subunit [Spirochaetales bacterium]|nr:ABC transporter permease subunit [Spirochaetales bacterium]